MPWGEDAFERAVAENKLVLISIGYSSCHWCHVMEHQSFENEAVAEIMNRHLVCIKVDREERPDIDQIYMTAVQLMTGQGGWPLNCFALPDGRPVYGGTYFPPDRWVDIIMQLADFWLRSPEKLLQYAGELEEGFVKIAEITAEQNTGWTMEEQRVMLEKWKKQLDTVHGGADRAPKFPMPANLRFLMNCSEQSAQQHVVLTLTKMAQGGICDHLAGGFFRYSTDHFWKVPHFEKMLYDNAQLMQVYAEAGKKFANTNFYNIADKIFDFLQEHFYNDSGLYSSSQDADSEGVEGKYYTWQVSEIEKCLTDEEILAAKRYFIINEHALWEGNYILLRSIESPHPEYEIIRKKLCDYRTSRIAPVIDQKQITSWNALLAEGMVSLYLSGRNHKHAEAARRLCKMLLKGFDPESGIKRIHQNGIDHTSGFLDDYAFTIAACLACYRIQFEEEYLLTAKQISKWVMNEFSHPDDVFFFYTRLEQQTPLTRMTETEDNVIPSSNAVMARNLLILSVAFQLPDMEERCKKMILRMKKNAMQYGSAYGYWALNAAMMLDGIKEVAVSGKNAVTSAQNLQDKIHDPFTLIFATEGTSNLPVLQKEASGPPGEIAFWVCKNQTCLPPVNTIEKTLEIL